MGIYNDLGFRDGMTGKEIAVLLAGQRSTWSLKLQSQDSAAQEEAQTKLLGIQLLTEAVTKISGDFQRPSLAMKTLCAAIDNELPNYREYEENMIRVCNEEANIANLNGILAYLNETGRDEVIDEWLMYLAEQGHTSAYQSYADRLLLRKDDALKAKEWYEKAIDAGRLDAEGYANYAETALADGSVQKAIDALKKADEMGNLEGAYRLAQIYDLGEDVRRNDDEALRLYQSVEKLAKGDLKERAQAGIKRVSDRIEARIEAERRRAEEYEKKFREAEAKAEAEYEAADEAKAAKLSAAAQASDEMKASAAEDTGAVTDDAAPVKEGDVPAGQDEAAKTDEAAEASGGDTGSDSTGNAACEQQDAKDAAAVGSADTAMSSVKPDDAPAEDTSKEEKKDNGTAADAAGKAVAAAAAAGAASSIADAVSGDADDIVISTISALLNENLQASQDKVDGVPDSFVKPTAAGERDDSRKRNSKNGRDRRASARQAARPDASRERQEKRDQAAGTARGRSSGSRQQGGQDRPSVQRDTAGRKTQHGPQEIRSGGKRGSSSGSGRSSGSPVGLIIIVIILLIILILLMLRMLGGKSGTTQQGGQDEVMTGTSVESGQESSEEEAGSAAETAQAAGRETVEGTPAGTADGSGLEGSEEQGGEQAAGERSVLDMLKGFDEHQVITSEFNESAYTVAVPSGYDATSELVSSSGRVYGVEYLFDRTLQKSWQDGVSGDGIGERIHVTFPQDTMISAIGIWNGTQSSSEYFRQNNRIKGVHLKLTYAGETYETDLELKDMMGEQAIVFDSPVPLEDFLMEIRSVTKGDSWDDTALAEMTFYTQKD